jgi:hypothetical protein
MPSRSTILLDFDNIFLGIYNQDPSLALDFANKPMDWLPRLAEAYLATPDIRRWLVARCYLNPAGSLPNPSRPGERIFFSRFRPGLVSAGFEVIDCPSMTSRGKNAADIRIVIDALDLLYHRSNYEEFVIASGDSDFTPLLQRLRADDRLITVVSPGIMSPAYSSLADKLIDFVGVEALVRPAPVTSSETMPPQVEGENSAGWEAFDSYVRTRYAEASGPLGLPSLAHAAAQVAPEALASNWFGVGFGSAILRLQLPNAHVAQNYLWDEERHEPPGSDQPHLAVDLPESIQTLVRLLDLPRLRRETWPAVFETLARYAGGHEFSLTEATRWSRDELANNSIHVGRPALGYVAKGAQFGGAPLSADPPPSAADLARAFCTSLIDRAYQAGLNLDAAEVEEISGWFGIEPDEPTSLPPPDAAA